MEEDKFVHPISQNTDAIAISRTLREIPPADYLFQIKSFALFSDLKEKRYESSDFISCGYTWKLILYPNGNEKDNGKDYISLYLAISDMNILSIGWEVNVILKLFVYDQIKDKYLTIQDVDGRVRRFHKLKTEMGFAKLLSLNIFSDTSNGYLNDDSCVFGAEVYVIKPNGRGECLSVVKEPSNYNIYTWKIKQFSNIEDMFLFSDAFTIGKRMWKICIYPKGDRRANDNDSLSMFLYSVDSESLPPKRQFYVEYKLRVKDQLNKKHVELSGNRWYSHSSKSWGFARAISLKDLHRKSRGFVVQDSVVVEAQIDVMSITSDFS